MAQKEFPECGRLMCCLAFEYEGYKHLADKLPPIGTKVNVDGVRGVVSAHHILKQTVDVKIAPDKADEKRLRLKLTLIVAIKLRK